MQTSNLKFESSVNSEGIEARFRTAVSLHSFESSVNSEGIEAQKFGLAM